jgi:hypothetical protein
MGGRQASAMPNWLKRLATNRMLDVGAVALTAAVLVWWSVILPSRWSDFDFNHYYVGGWMLRAGQNPYTRSLQSVSHQLGFRYAPDLPTATYPPPFLGVFEVLSVLPPRAAFALWVALEIGCLGVILWLTRRLLSDRLTWRGWLFVAALAVISRTVSYSLYYSQVQLMLAALVLAAYAARRAGRHGWACLSIATAGMLKLYPFILLPWFIWSGDGGARGRCARLIGVMGFVFAVVMVTGPGLWGDFFRFGMPTIAVWEEAGRSFQFSLPSLVANLGNLRDNFQAPLEARRWWWLAGNGVGATVIAVAYVICLTSRRDPEAQFCLLCTAMLIGTVTVQGHYFVFLVFPLTVAALRMVAKPSRSWVVSLMVAVLAFNYVDPPDSLFLGGHPFLYLLISYLPLYALIALAAFFWRELRDREGPVPSPAIAGGRQERETA